MITIGVKGAMNNNATGFYNKLWHSNWGDLQRYGPIHRHQDRMLRSLTSKLEWDTVLDVGCGAGQNLKRICEGRKCSRIVGVDISEHALGFSLQNMPEAEFRVVDIEHELLDERFDLVLCIQVLEHIADDNAAIEHLCAMTGKYLICASVSGTMHESEQEIGHLRHYKVGELEEMLREHGLRILQSIYWGFPFYDPIFRWLQHASGAGEQVGAGTYGIARRALCHFMWLLYFLNSDKKGELEIVAAENPI